MAKNLIRPTHYFRETTMNNLETIRAACIKANPEISKRSEYDFEGNDMEQRVSLADVLLAIESVMKPDWQITLSTLVRHSGGIIWHIQVTHTNGGYDGGNWNLRKDSLEEQPPETLQFLADLLTH